MLRVNVDIEEAATELEAVQQTTGGIVVIQIAVPAGHKNLAVCCGGDRAGGGGMAEIQTGEQGHVLRLYHVQIAIGVAQGIELAVEPGSHVDILELRQKPRRRHGIA